MLLRINIALKFLLIFLYSLLREGIRVKLVFNSIQPLVFRIYHQSNGRLTCDHEENFENLTELVKVRC